jgi:hypothetical protein
VGIGFIKSDVHHLAIEAGFDTDDFLHKGATAVSVGELSVRPEQVLFG